LAPDIAAQQAAVARMSPEAKQKAYEQEVAALDSRLGRLEAYVGGFPKSLIDVAALAQSLTTPQAAFEFVRDQVAIEPYTGVMKGARGTLVTRGGNALDRALLLAALLKELGVAATIAHGTLPADRAQALAAETAARPAACELIAQSVAGLPAAARSSTAAGAAGVDVRGSIRARRAELDSTIQASARTLQSSLQARGLKSSPSSGASYAGRFEHHYWVRAEIDGKDVGLDPSFRSATFGQAFVEVGGTDDPESLPDEWFQTLEFQVVTEHLQGTSLERAEVLSYTVRASALFGANVRLAIMPRTATPDVNEFRATLIVGDETTEGRPFGLRGVSGGEEAGDAESSGLGQNRTAGDLFGGAFGGGEEKKPAPASRPAPKGGSAGPPLARVALEVVSKSPDAPEARYRRVIADRAEPRDGGVQLQPALADDGAIRTLLLQVWDGTVGVGPTQPLYVFEAELAAMKAAESYEKKVRAAVYLGQELQVDDVPGPMLSAELVNYFFASDGAQGRLRQQAGKAARRFYERPRLAFFRHGVAVADWGNPRSGRRFEEGIDLLNAPFVFTGPAAEAADLALRLGIVDTTLERTRFGGRPVFNALPLFAAAVDQKIPTEVFEPSQRAALDRLDLPVSIKSVLVEDLTAGHALVLPSRLVTLNGTRTFGWWSVDPASGYAIGRMELGGAQGLAEVTKTHERVTKWTEIYVKFMGGVLRCYMTALAENLGSVEFDGIKPTITLNQGGPGESPMPEFNKLVECAIEKACDALEELLTDAMTEAALFQEAEAVEEIIAKLVEKEAINQAGSGANEICNAVMNKALGG
jgi:hypothetical protein